MKTDFFIQQINWAAVKKEVNKRFKSDYERHYLQAIYRGNLFSSKIKNVLDELLPSYRKMKKAA